MNIQTNQKSSEGVIRSDLYINGDLVGEIDRRDEGGETRFHAMLRYPGGSLLGLIHGHGKTEVEAIINAIKGEIKNNHTRTDYLNSFVERYGVEV